MRSSRYCRYCRQIFQPSRYRPQQSVCSEPDCQRRRRSDYHRERIRSDSTYAEDVRSVDCGIAVKAPQFMPSDLAMSLWSVARSLQRKSSITSSRNRILASLIWRQTITTSTTLVTYATTTKVRRGHRNNLPHWASVSFQVTLVPV